MHLSRVNIKNFRNFSDLEVVLSNDFIIVGENRVGKSNFIHALRLVLDASLPDSARQLKFSDIWDGAIDADEGVDPDLRVEIDVEFVGFDEDDALCALLTDYRLAEDHETARLSYVFRMGKEPDEGGVSEADYEFKLFGGGDETRSIPPHVRRRISLDVLDALRDAEGALGAWRYSPLRPLIEDAIGEIDGDALSDLAEALDEAADKLANLAPIEELETSVRGRIADLAGAKHDLKAKLGFAESDPLKMFRSLRLFIDDGIRGINDASLGSANVALLALKLAEFDWRRQKNERNFTLVTIEEPEAHLHPQLQRKVFGTLFDNNEANEGDEGRSLILTTHSPNVASVAPVRSIVLLKDEGDEGAKAYSLADLELADEELDDLQRYLNASRAEVLFSRGVLFVEGDAEEAILPVFAKCLGHDLDDLGITVCSVGGTNFKPYAKLAAALSIPFSVVTDWDPGVPVSGWDRALDLIAAIRKARKDPELTEERQGEIEDDEEQLRGEAEAHGIFLNNDTLEKELAATPNLAGSMIKVLSEQGFGARRNARLADWAEDHASINSKHLMSMIADVRKGRFAQQLAEKLGGAEGPEYISSAIKNVAERG